MNHALSWIERRVGPFFVFFQAGDAADLRSVDEAIGHLLETLRARGLYDETMIIVTSDHGNTQSSDSSVGRASPSRSLRDDALHVPLVVKYPDSRHAGRVIETQVRSIDIAPTALAGLGLPIPPSFAGSNLEIDTRPGANRRLAALSMLDSLSPNPIWSLRTMEWKAHSHPRRRLFDLLRDPAESTNLASEQPARFESYEFMADTILSERPAAPLIRVMPSRPRSVPLRSGAPR
jgi:arylsulfatase A-like enzyme